jgi:hypothetical protein
MNPYAEKLKAGKERMRQLCIQVALANTPVSVRAIRIRRTLPGRAYSTSEIAVPRPFTRRALHIFLHECAYVFLGHVKADKAAQFVPTLPHGRPGGQPRRSQSQELGENPAMLRNTRQNNRHLTGCGRLTSPYLGSR